MGGWSRQVLDTNSVQLGFRAWRAPRPYGPTSGGHADGPVQQLCHGRESSASPARGPGNSLLAFCCVRYVAARSRLGEAVIYLRSLV